MRDVKINYLHFCDAANIDSLGKISILGIFNKIFLQNVPYRFPRFTIVFNLSFKNLGNARNKISIKILTPSKQELEIRPPIEVEFTVNEIDLKKYGNINLILDITNLEFKSYGKHNVIIYLNNEQMTIKELLVEEKRVI